MLSSSVRCNLISTLPTAQPLITYCMQKQRGRPGQFYHVNHVNVYLDI